jgi:hypothetical protein
VAKPKDAAKAAAKGSPDRLWMPRTMCALLCGVAPSAFDFSIKPRIEMKNIRVDNNSTYYYAPAVVVAYNEWQTSKAVPKKETPTNEADNRRKLAAAEREELELLKEKEKVVSVEDWESRIAGEFWRTLEAHGRTVKRAFGNEGIRYFNDLLDELRRVLNVEKEPG